MLYTLRNISHCSVQLFSVVHAASCADADPQKTLSLPESYFIDGQILVRDQYGFSAPQLVETIPPNVNVDVLGYDGRDFFVKNSFDIDYHTSTRGRSTVTFRYHIYCRSRRSTSSWQLVIDNDNDEVPTLADGVVSNTFYADVSELATPGTIIPFTFSNKIEDVDPGDIITYSMRVYPGYDYGLNPFRMINNQGQGDIQINGTLDYESQQRQHVYQVFADDMMGHRLTVILIIHIKDGNDLSPKFNRSSYTLSLPENSAVGSKHLTTPPIAAFDQDLGIGEALLYSLYSGHSIYGTAYFGIDVSSGEIVVQSSLDREVRDRFLIVLKVVEKYDASKYSTSSLTIYITDVNDSPPLFEKAEYSATVIEHSPQNTVIVEVVASDRDLNSELTFSLDSYMDRLRVEKTGPSTAEVIVYNSDLVDRELLATLTVTVVVSDGVAQGSTQLTITVTDINDQTPVFFYSVYSFPPVNETAAVGHVIGHVRAEDADVGVNGYVRYRIAQGPPDLFAINKETGLVSVAAELTANYLPFYELRVEAYDAGTPPLSSVATVRISVIDQNTQRPVFHQTYYHLQVLEDTPIGSTLVNLEATDADAGAEIVYRMSAMWLLHTPPEDMFSVIESTGEVLLNAALDRETDDFFKFQVTAFDGYYYSLPAATVEVKVVDVNDNAPTFADTYTFIVSEGCGSRCLGRLGATDLDIGINADLTYFVLGNEYFIDSKSGVLNITRCVDRESVSTMSVVVYVKDGVSELYQSRSLTGSTLVSVTVTDVNDNKPLFSQPQYMLSYREGFSGSIDLPQVLDADLPPNDQSVISMISGDDSYFRLSADEIVVLKPLSVPPGSLLFEYTIGLKVTNTEAYVGPVVPDNTATLTLQVTSVNTHDPQFTKQVYSVQVLENLEVGSDILTLRASDGDGDEISFMYANHTWSVITDMFWLDSQSGTISLKQEVNAEDLILSGPFVFQVIAKDPFGRFSLATVNVTVVDINDNAPHIETDKSEIVISESLTVQSALPIIISVSDRDSGPLGAVSCFVEPSAYLDIYQCTTIFLIKQVDYEEVKVLRAVISAADYGDPPLSSSLPLTINILAENDNLPVFEQLLYVFNVSENVPGRITVGTVRATDLDLDTIDYSLQPPSVREMFSISSMGLLYATRSLDREVQEEYNFNVVASDGKLSTAVRTTVYVLDQNDNPPIFIQDIGLYYINESEPNNHILQVSAVDNLDVGLNAEVVYEILSGNEDELFEINNVTGVVGVTRPHLVDYETKREYKLILQAKDLGYPTQYATIGITIKVKDVNEFAPQFGASSYEARIPENLPNATLVAQVTAADSDGNSHVSFSIRSADFSINSRGIVMTASVLDGDIVPTRNVSISACDDFGLCAYVTLYVYLTDVNDNIPEFPAIPSVFNVTEDTPPGTFLFNASAIDIDRDDVLSYWIAGAVDLLSMDSSSGIIRITGSPRASEMPVYHVTIYASDGPHRIQAPITINIHEANLYTPMFSKFAYHEVLCETDKIYEVIMQISVTDEDEGVDGMVDVRIVGGDWNSTFAIRRLPELTNTFELVNKRPLVFSEKPYFELELEASDRARYPRYDYSRATIRLLSGSINPPQLQSVVTGDITVSDKAAVGDIVYTFVALVKTSEEKESLRFSVSPDDSGYAVDDVTGHLVLMTNNPAKQTVLNVSACSTTSSECVGGLNTKLCSSTIVILNVKDEPELPHFYPTSYFDGNVTENILSSPIVDIYANQSTGDPVNLTMIYNELYGELFTLVDNVIWNTAPLDREYQDAYNLLIIAYGQAGVTTANVHIRVLDVNDEPPVFVFSEFREEATESQTFAGHVITEVSVTDADSDPQNKQVVFEIVPSHDAHFFRLMPRGQHCDVILTEQLDADIVSNETVATVIYSIMIRAYDPNSPSMRTNTTVQVLVRDDNDNTPVFTRAVYNFVTEEEIEPSTTGNLGAVRALDIDKVDIGKVRYGLLEPTDYLVIDSVYGMVHLNKTIDKELISHLSFTVQAFDSGGHVGNASLEIEILDRNDNRPNFLNDTFDFDTLEGAASLTSIELLITDADFGFNSALTFTKNGLACGLLTLDSTQTDEHTYKLVVESVMEMDRESDSVPHLTDGTAVYSCIITAIDNGSVQLSSSKMVTFNVHDVNDSPPRFSSRLFEWAMTEVSPINFTVGYVTATDQDHNEEHRLMVFELQQELSSLFTLDAQSGELYLSRQVASQSSDIGMHTMRVVTYDPSSPEVLRDEATVKVHILDSNDHAPVFTQLRYIFTISQKSQSNYVGQVSATDNDTDAWNSEVTYSLRFFNNDLQFSIDNKTGVITSSLIDLETAKTFLFAVVAHDRGIPQQRGSAIVEVKVIAFSTSSYLGTIDEGSTFPKAVDVQPPIYAVDTTAVSSIVYTLIPRDGLGIFSIDEITGVVSVKTGDPEILDFERTSVYFMRVVAGERNGYGVEASLTIALTDINDNPPVFSQLSYNFTVSENSRNMVLGRVTSSDVDTNSQTVYKLTGDVSPFLVDADTGVLRVTGGLDVEQYPIYYLEVEARDRERPDFYDTAAITIVVEDINDNSPVFTEDAYSWSVPEDTAVNTVIGAVSAGDLENDTLLFSIANNSQADLPFAVHRMTGELMLTKELDREKKSRYRFSIKAEDSTLANFTQVSVTVSDVNDNVPSFGEESYIGSVAELSPVLSVVIVVFATDADEMKSNNSKITYSLEGVGSQYFDVTAQGVIRVKQQFTRFQLMQQNQLTTDNSTIGFSAIASDQGDPSLSSSAEISLAIQSQDEDVPKFRSAIYEIEVNEHLPLGTKVATVEAKVKDSSLNNGIVLVYRLIGSHPAFVMIDSLSGNIYTQTVIDREIESFFVYTVEAVDNRSPPKTGYVTVTITLLDINDHPPEFDTKRLEFSRTEGTYDSVLLTQVQAWDADTGINSEITYSIIGSSQDGLFSMGPTTGEIYMSGNFDYEIEQQFHLTIEAIDNGAVRLTDTLDLYLYLTDANDNSPQFEKESYGPYTVKENVHEVEVASVIATDRDSGYNGEVYYSLVQGDITGDFLLLEENSTAVLSVREFLDYEKVPQYNLTLVAYDLGRPRKTSQLIIQVNVEDVSDSKPVFQQPLYEIFVSDNVTVGTVLLELFAGYGVFVYSISGRNEYFSINSTTGHLSVSKPLLGGSDHQLSVQAKDIYIPPTTASTVVKIVVEESDPEPRFAKETYAAFVDENIPPPVEVIDLTSSDEQRGRAVTYEIIEGNDDALFALDEFTGCLYSNVEFDREVKELYSLRIQAFRVEFVRKRDTSALYPLSANENFSYVNAQPSTQSNGMPLQQRMILKRENVLESSSAINQTVSAGSVRNVRETSRQLDTTTVKVTIRDVNDNAPKFETEEHIGIPDSAVQGDIVTYIRASDPDAGDNATIAFGLIQSSTYFRIASETGAVILLAESITLSQYDLAVEAVDNNGHSTGQRASKQFRLIVTRDESRVSYQARIPYKDLPSDVHLAGNLSRILGTDVRIENAESISDTVTNITLFAFADKDTMMSKTDLLDVLNDHQVELNAYFANLSDIITVTAKPIISSRGGGATDIAFIVMGLVVGAAAIFGILLLTIYWKQIESQRVIAEQKGEQGDLIEDDGAEKDADDDSGVLELDESIGTMPDNQMYGGMGMPAAMMYPGLMFPPGNNPNWINPYQMPPMSAQQLPGQP